MPAHRWKVGAIVVVGIAAVYFVIQIPAAYRDAQHDGAASAVATTASARIEPILGPNDFAALGSGIGPDFGVTAEGEVAFSAGGRLHAIMPGNWLPRLQPIKIIGDQPQSFVLDARGPMLGIANGYLGLLEEDGQFGAARPLPNAPMRLAPSVHPGAFYMFGGAHEDYRLYRFIDDGTLQVLMLSREPIVDAADSEQDVYAATARAVLKVKAGEPETLFAVPDAEFGGPIRSLAVTGDEVVLFSTDTKVYALLGSAALSIVNDAGGALRIRGDALYVLDPRRAILFALRPASLRLLDTVLQ